ncbi:MAG TPA: glycosyltransferase [Candidatus Paceibacterota bacterium]|nr:glycosyltransferase [Verrucomicrobiota bacterium]HRY49524.1 glycosyltransferase [Candidatus Paceibacterota bacterium]HSA00984.1 glycosyltransferase [Candidatus Paceibacterota bacterium]
MKPWRSIFTVVPDVHAGIGHYQSLWQRHFYDGMAEAVPQLTMPQGIDFSWIERDPLADREKVSHQRAKASQQLWDQIRRVHSREGLDAVISYCFAGDLELDLVREVIRMGVPWINFFCDSTHRFLEIEALARVVSLNWFPEHAAIERYRAVGAACFCQPYAMNPRHLADAVSQECRIPVAFIGLPSANRITQLGWLLLGGIRIQIHGHGWQSDQGPFHNPHQPARRRLWRALGQPDFWEKVSRRLLWPLVKKHASGPLSDDEFPEFLRHCGLILGMNQGRDEHGRLASYLKFRDLEFPGMGCCYLTEYNQDVEGAFELDREVLAYRSLGEAKEKIRFYLRHPDSARAIGIAGRRKVLAQHTWSVRMAQMAEALGKRVAGG